MCERNPYQDREVYSVEYVESQTEPGKKDVFLVLDDGTQPLMTVDAVEEIAHRMYVADLEENTEITQTNYSFMLDGITYKVVVQGGPSGEVILHVDGSDGYHRIVPTGHIE